MVLKEINVPLWEQDNCGSALQQQFGAGYSLPDTALCAGAEGRDACDVSEGDDDDDLDHIDYFQGDGGGPLVCEQDGQWYQVGSEAIDLLIN